jgi:uncharacterized protein YecE (DUF72 family)
VARIWLGTSGFSYKEWRPAFYPADLPEKAFLRHYATRFNSVEINSTFYRMPGAKTIEAWKASTGEDFRFALKASRRITHQERLRVPSDALTYLLDVVGALGGRLGLLLFQLPPDFRRDVPRLDLFLSALPRGFPAAFEFRHASWFCPEVFDLLRKREVALCARDADEGSTPLEITAPFACVRLRRSSYDKYRIEEWRRRFRGWAERGLDVYAYVKHEDNPDAPLIARAFAEDLRAAG